MKVLRLKSACMAAALAMFLAWQPCAAEQAGEVVRVQLSKYLSYTPLFIAFEEGFFAA